MFTQHFWLASVLSGCIHAGLFGLVWAIGLSGQLTGASLLVPYGNASVEGLSVDPVSENPGSLWQDEQDRPGGALHQGVPRPMPPQAAVAAETQPGSATTKIETAPVPFVNE